MLSAPNVFIMFEMNVKLIYKVAVYRLRHAIHAAISIYVICHFVSLSMPRSLKLSV